MGAPLSLSQNRVSHLEAHADELSFKQLLTWWAWICGWPTVAGRSPVPRLPAALRIGEMARALRSQTLDSDESFMLA